MNIDLIRLTLEVLSKMYNKELRDLRYRFYSSDYEHILKNAMQSFSDIKMSYGNEITNRGLFVLCTSILESTITETLYKFFLAYPNHMDKEVKISTSDLKQIDQEGIDLVVKNEINKITRKSIKDQIIYFSEKIIGNRRKKEQIASIMNEIQTVISPIDDFSKLRNKITHSWSELSLNEISGNELNSYIILVEKLLNLFHDAISMIYLMKSRIQVLKDAWEMTMKSDILKFDDYWEYNLDLDLITAIKCNRYESALSSSERVKLSYWRYNFSESKEYETIPYIASSLDNENIKNLAIIQRVFHEVDFYYMNQQSEGKY